MKNVTQKAFDGLVGLSVLVALMLVTGLAQADSTSNVKVGLKQGGTEMYVKTGGQIKVRDVSMFQLPLIIADIGTASSTGRAMAPYPATVSSIRCAPSIAAIDGTTVLTAKINGVLIGTGTVGVTSTAAAFTNFTITPSSANTVARGSVISVESDGTTTVAPVGICSVTLTP